MKRVNVRDLHLKTSFFIEAATKGEAFIIEKRGTPVAELRPLEPTLVARKLPYREKALARPRRVRTDSGRILEEERS